MIGFVILLAISAIVALFAHTLIKNFFAACLWSGIISTIIFQITGYFVMGYLDPFFLIALLIGFIVSSAVATLIGIPVIMIKYKKSNKNE